MRDKIIITSEECESVTPLPPSNQVQAAFTPYSFATCDTYESSEESHRTWPWVAGVVTVITIIILVVASVLIYSTGNVISYVRTIDDVKAEVVTFLNTKLASPTSTLRKRVENAHLTVAVARAEVVECEIKTTDGSSIVGKDNDNISSVSILIRFHWNGIIHDGGTTDLRVELDSQGKIVKSQIEKTNALINVEDPKFWWNWGFLLGTALLG